MAPDPQQESRRRGLPSATECLPPEEKQPSILFSSDQERQSLWRLYRDFVRNHGVLLNLLEDTLNQLLFWTPQNSNEDDRWREVLYGLLSLHRMATDMAQQDEIPEFYGTTVEVEPKRVSATSMRIAITVVHSILPTVLQLCSREQRPRVRFLLEQVKFVLRLVLMGSYWYQLSSENKLESCGLVMSGGMMMQNAVGVTVEQEQAWRQRQAYVGRRTGRMVVKATRSKYVQTKSVWPLIMGELLHIYRPLHWAGVERHNSPSLVDWASILGMDVVSLLLLQRNRHSALSGQELRRRKFKMFLYLLRSPIFDKYTKPAASRAFSGVGKIPLVGSLLETYLWDWLLYWKHPFAAEED